MPEKWFIKKFEVNSQAGGFDTVNKLALDFLDRYQLRSDQVKLIGSTYGSGSAYVLFVYYQAETELY